MKTQYFKLHSNGKVCRVVDVETNLVGGKGFDVFVKIIEPDHSGQPGWNYEMWVAVCRGEFVDVPISHEEQVMKTQVHPYEFAICSNSAEALLYWRTSFLFPFDAEDRAFSLAMLRKVAAQIIAGAE